MATGYANLRWSAELVLGGGSARASTSGKFRVRAALKGLRWRYAMSRHSASLAAAFLRRRISNAPVVAPATLEPESTSDVVAG